jgi:hypothetical protein
MLNSLTPLTENELRIKLSAKSQICEAKTSADGDEWTGGPLARCSRNPRRDRDEWAKHESRNKKERKLRVEGGRAASLAHYLLHCQEGERSPSSGCFAGRCQQTKSTKSTKAAKIPPFPMLKISLRSRAANSNQLLLSISFCSLSLEKLSPTQRYERKMTQGVVQNSEEAGNDHGVSPSNAPTDQFRWRMIAYSVPLCDESRPRKHATICHRIPKQDPGGGTVRRRKDRAAIFGLVWLTWCVRFILLSTVLL